MQLDAKTDIDYELKYTDSSGVSILATDAMLYSPVEKFVIGCGKFNNNTLVFQIHDACSAGMWMIFSIDLVTENIAEYRITSGSQIVQDWVSNFAYSQHVCFTVFSELFVLTFVRVDSN